MYRFLVILMALMCFQPARPQKTVDVVYLRNGSIIRGTLSEKNDTTVKILTCCGSVFAFPAREVTRITQEKAVRTIMPIPRRGYMNFTSFGVLVGSTVDQKSAPFSAIMEHNYRFNKYLAVGGFLGFEQLNENVLPIGSDLKVFFPAGRTDFFMSCSGGYSISLEKPDETGMKKATGGMMAATEAGIIIPVSQGSALTLAIGYRYNVLNYNLNDWRGDYTRNTTYNRLMIRFGISVF
jgi:hypothetical protein